MKVRNGYIITRTNKANDCDGCALALSCIRPCDLPKGYHIEKKA